MFSDPHAAALHYLERADILARNRCIRPCDRDDLAQEGILVLMQVASRYAAANRQVDEPDKFASRVMSRAMHWWNYKMHANRGCVIEYAADLEAVLHPGARRHRNPVRMLRVNIVGDDDLFAHTLVREFFDELERLHGTDVRLIAENLVLPGPEAVMVALENQTDKRIQYESGQPVRGWDKLCVSRTHIREAFCVSRFHWQQHIRTITEFGQQFFGPRTSSLTTS